MAKCPKVGTRVCFRGGNPAEIELYRRGVSWALSGCGSVTSLYSESGRRKQTCIDGPRGGLVYVKWDRGGKQGVYRMGAFRDDLVSERSGKALGRSGRRRRR